MNESSDNDSDRHPQTQAILGKKRWHEEVEKAFEGADPIENPVSVIFMDVNSFKQINDRLGHARGDEVIEELRELVGIVVNNLRAIPDSVLNREADIISTPDFDDTRPRDDYEPQAGHVGGDEFAILAYTDQHGANIIKLRLLEAFEEYITDPKRKDFIDLGVGLAMGSSTITGDMASSSDLLKAADKNMYQNKIEQLKELGRLRKIMFRAGSLALKASGVRLRDIDKYLNKYGLAE